MPILFTFLQAVWGWRRAIVLGGVIVVLGTALWSTEGRRAELQDEVHWLEARLADRRAMVTRQREEMAEVAESVDRLISQASVVRERAAQVRRLAHMEESQEIAYDVVLARATADDGGPLVSEDAARALQQLAWLEGQAANVGDSLAVLTALLRETSAGPRTSVPSIWPVSGLVTSAFGRRRSPWGDHQENHAGLDISARWGAPVTATGDGKVVFAGRDSGYGGLVIVDHGSEIDTLYAHLSALYVREGQFVRRGQALGAVGATGRTTGAHLHYEVRVRGNPVDPRRYLETRLTSARRVTSAGRRTRVRRRAS